MSGQVRRIVLSVAEIPATEGLKMSKQTHYVDVLLTSGKVIQKAYRNTGEMEISHIIQDYQSQGARYGVQSINVYHTDGTSCPELVVA